MFLILFLTIIKNLTIVSNDFMLISFTDYLLYSVIFELLTFTTYFNYLRNYESQSVKLEFYK